MIAIKGYPTLDVGLNELKRYVAAAEERGKKVTVFCEDRLTLLAEKSVCEELGGSFLTSVTTFARFLSCEGKILSKQGSVMAIGKILAQNEDKLTRLAFRGSIKRGAQTVYETLSQLFASKVDGETLRGVPAEGLLKEKLNDLALVYDEYEKYLHESNYVDENRYLSFLPTCIEKDENIRGQVVVFLGFSSFTAQALDGVKAACENAEDVLGLFPAGKEEIYCNQAATAFRLTVEQFGDVKVSQIKIEEKQKRLCDILREDLYSPDVFSPAYQGVDCQGKVLVKQMNNIEDELRFVCARTVKHIIEGGRFGDISVFVPDVKGYSLLLAKTFGEYQIPYFIDQKKPISAHPFSYFLLSILRAVADGFSPVNVGKVASSCYFGDNGAYRNYLLKYANYRGGVKKEIKDEAFIKGYNRDYLVTMRERMLAVTQNLFKRKDSGYNYCAAVKKLYAFCNADEVTAKLIADCQDGMQKEFLETIKRALDTVLLEAEALLGGWEMPVTDFLTLIETGLTSMEIPLLPLRQDEVFVGDIAQSRERENKIVFALGMGDEVPMQGADTALVSDKEMGQMEAVKVKIEPSVAQVNDRTRESVCLNVCSFTDRLYLLYCSSAESERSASEILRYASVIFKNVAKDEDLFIYQCARPMPALRELLLRRDSYEEGLTSSRKEYASLYRVLQKKEGERVEVETLFKGIEPECFIENSDKIYFDKENISPTLLEKYHVCPYKCFIEQGLSLQECEESALMITDTGNFVHTVLEEVAQNMDDLPDESACYDFATKKGEELFTKVSKYANIRDTAAGEYTHKRLVKEAASIAVEMYKQVVGSKFKVAQTECRCNLSKEMISGKIDRVDEYQDYVRIIDYKTGGIDASVKSYYMGKKLQLQLYMLAVSEGKTPAGIYYFPAQMEYRKEGEIPCRMQGFTNGNAEVLQASDTSLEMGKSAFIDAEKTASGWKKSEAQIKEEDFLPFLEYALLVSKQGRMEMGKGFIASTPAGLSSCGYCPYKGMCASFGTCVERDDMSIKAKQVADIVKQAKGDK